MKAIGVDLDGIDSATLHGEPKGERDATGGK